jgi:hypothetical protein
MNYKKYLPYFNCGKADWCGRFIILHAPIVLSRKMGRGEIGLQWTLWQEKRK